MGGVNLSEESQNILATNSELMTGQLRSCHDENFLHSVPLRSKINAIGGYCFHTLAIFISHQEMSICPRRLRQRAYILLEAVLFLLVIVQLLASHYFFDVGYVHISVASLIL